MTTKAIEAGARAIWEDQHNRIRDPGPIAASLSWRSKRVPDIFWDGYMTDAKACIEAAIASGELVPATAVAAELERCAALIRSWTNHSKMQLHAGEMTAQEKRTTEAVLNAIERQVSALPAPASGKFVVVPREPTREILDAIVTECKFAWGIGNREIKHVPFKWAGEWREVAKPFYRAMLNAASRNGDGK